MTVERAGQPMNRGSVPWRGRVQCPDKFCGWTVLVPNGCLGLFSGD